MKVARNITRTAAGYRVRIVREYLDQRLSCYVDNIEEAIAVRDTWEEMYPIRSPHHHPAKAKCQHCGQPIKSK